MSEHNKLGLLIHKLERFNNFTVRPLILADDTSSHTTQH
jgi:hypothetical protein